MRIRRSVRGIALLTLPAFAWLTAGPCPAAWAEKQYRTKVYFYHGDHLGSTNLVTDQAGQVVQRIDYTPHGLPYRMTGEDVSPHKFTGKRLDASTGLYYYGARYYDPQFGRFIQPDSIVQAPGDPQTLNRYAYARNNPLIYTDPTGHSFWNKVKGFFKSFGTAVAQVAGVALAPFTGGASLWLTAAATMASGAQAAANGNFGAWAAGFSASVATGFFAAGFVAPAMAGWMAGGSPLTAFQGGIITAMEFGLAGAAGGVAGTLASGGGLGQAFKNGGIGFGIGAAMGGGIGYTYAANMQSVLHGFDTRGYNSTVSNYHQIYGNLNAAEQSFVRQHPIASYKIMQAGTRSLVFAQEGAMNGNVWGGTRGLHNGHADAVRHAHWGASSSRAVGDSLAADFLTRHETFFGNPAAEFQMDMANNHAGIALGVNQNTRASSTDQVVMDAYRNDRLQTELYGN